MVSRAVPVVLAAALSVTGCAWSDGSSADERPPSTLRPPPTPTPTPTASPVASERGMSPPPVRRTSSPRTYSVRRLAAAPCELLDSQDELALRATGPGVPGSGDGGTHTCIWLVSGGLAVGVWVDEDPVPPAMPGKRSRVRGHRVLQFRQEAGAVCYTAATVGRRAIVITTDADSAPSRRPEICKLGKKVVAKMLAHVR